MALISVILPTCDRPALLPRAAQSVLAQADVELELVVVDSNRRTGLVAEVHASEAWMRDARVRIVVAPHATNAASARNAGLEVARGGWVSYLDDDDAYRPGKLARQAALARAAGAALVLCGAEFFLRGRRRRVQCDTPAYRGDDLLLRARWNTPLLLHRAVPALRFDASLAAGEDGEFAHRLLAQARGARVPNVPAPLVEIHPQPRGVNRNPVPVRAAAAKILALPAPAYSRPARRRFVLRTLLAAAKLRHDRARTLGLAVALLRESGGADWRVCSNAVAVSWGVLRGRWVS